MWVCFMTCSSNWKFNGSDSFALIRKVCPLFGRFCHRTDHVHPCNWVTKVLAFVVHCRFTFEGCICIWLREFKVRWKHVEIVFCGALFFFLTIVYLNLATLRERFKLLFNLRFSVLNLGLFHRFDRASRSDHTLRRLYIHSALRIFNLSILGSHTISYWNVRDGDLVQAWRTQYWFPCLWWTSFSLRKLRSFLRR